LYDGVPVRRISAQEPSEKRFRPLPLPTNEVMIAGVVEYDWGIRRLGQSGLIVPLRLAALALRIQACRLAQILGRPRERKGRG
jgi:hypothetical protein